MKKKMAIFSLLFALWSISIPLHAKENWKDAVQKSAIEYADKKKNELVEASNKKAIVALYKKIYPELKNKSDREALRSLGELGMNATKLNMIASDLASGDPDKMQSASETLAVGLGEQLTKSLKENPELQKKMTSMLGSADKVKEISTVLGEAAGGNSDAAYKYAADMVINAAGGGGVVGFYRTAYGVMKFANDAYMDSTIEDLYQEYKKGTLTKEELQDSIDYIGGNHVAIRDKIQAERAQKLADLGGNAKNIPPELLEHLTHVDEETFKQKLISGFEARIQKEDKDQKNQAYAQKMNQQAQEILDQLDSVARDKYGKDWWKSKGYNLNQFVEIIQNATQSDGTLDPNRASDLRIMSRLLSKKLIYGKNSSEYLEALKEFSEFKKALSGGAPPQTQENYDFSGTLSGSWHGKSTGGYNVNAGGSFQMHVLSNGVISGSYGGDDSGSLNGVVNSSGQMNLKTGGGTAGSSRWRGTITRTDGGGLRGNGSWSSKGWSGSWSGTGN